MLAMILALAKRCLLDDLGNVLTFDIAEFKDVIQPPGTRGGRHAGAGPKGFHRVEQRLPERLTLRLRHQLVGGGIAQQPVAVQVAGVIEMQERIT